MMRSVAVRNVTRELSLATRAGVADSFWLRLRGLLGRRPLQAGEGLLIQPCRGVHMVGMKYPIDVAFLDRNARVVGLSHSLKPGAKSGWHRNAHSALELPARILDATGTVVGDQLTIEEIVSSTLSQRARSTVVERDSLPGIA